ncbi:MAG: DUF1622 domain-containing protein [Candidatus Velthaea sp.]
MIEFSGALIIAGYALVAMVVLVYHRGSPERARYTVASGVLFALSIDVAATLLKTVALHTWTQLATFATVFAIRTFVKRTLPHEPAHESACHDT